MVSAAALAVFRLGRGEVGNDASGRVAGWQFMIWGSGFANLFWDRRREFPMKIFSPYLNSTVALVDNLSPDFYSYA
jgi:hypothetical protein